MKKISETTFTVIDIETTGISAKYNRIIEIALVKVFQDKIIDKFSSFVDPEAIIPFHITQLTGISNNDVKSAPLFYELIDDINEFIDDTVIVAHNSPFDFTFLKEEYNRAGKSFNFDKQLCTLKLSRRIFPNIGSKSLSSLTKKLRIRHINKHRALGDAEATAKLLFKIIGIAEKEFEISGIDELLKLQNKVSSNSALKVVKKTLINDLDKVPDIPGVYLFKDNKGKIIYIGKAKSLKKRVKNYFSKYAANKAKKIIKAASNLDYIKTNSELTSLLLESELIKTHSPKFNTLLKKYSQTHFIKINNVFDFPKIEKTSIFEFNENDYFGPYANRYLIADLVDIINRTYKIRECTERDFKKKRSCYLRDIKRCLAPCISECTKEEYHSELNLVYDFLEGKNQLAIDRLLNKMKLLSESKKYEEAAETRDTIQKILAQINKSSLLKEPINKAEILLKVYDGYKHDFILMLKGKVFLKNEFLENQAKFDDVLDDYFEGTYLLIEELTDRDLERTKITLNWLIKNKEKVKFYYLKDYTNKNELYLAMEG